jgi:hypothetical protein
VIELSVAHMPTGRIGHLIILQMKLSHRKAVERADMIVMQVRQDHVLDLVHVTTQERQSFARRA